MASTNKGLNENSTKEQRIVMERKLMDGVGPRLRRFEDQGPIDRIFRMNLYTKFELLTKKIRQKSDR